MNRSVVIHHNTAWWRSHRATSRCTTAKLLACAKGDLARGCQHVVRGETDEEALTKAAEQAQEHGIRAVTPALMQRVKANIRDA